MFSRIKTLFARQPIRGIVLDKKSYGAGGEQNHIPTAPGKFNGRAAEGVAGAWIAVDDTTGWNLILRTPDGKTKTVSVDENTYNNAELGDHYGPAH